LLRHCLQKNEQQPEMRSNPEISENEIQRSTPVIKRDL
jgi:hypothetical protein